MIKKKILFVIDSLNSGGAEKSLVTLLGLLDREKYDIYLMTFVGGGLYTDLVPDYIVRKDSPLYSQYLKGGNKNISLYQRFKFFYSKILSVVFSRCLFFLRQAGIKIKLHPAQIFWASTQQNFKVLDKKYDVAIAYSQGFPTYFVAKKVRAIKKICWINTDYNLAGYAPRFDYDYYNIYNTIVTVSDKSQEVFLKSHPRFLLKTTVVYDILAEGLILQMADKYQPFDDKYTGIKILTIGRLTPLKGYEIAIEAAAYLKEKDIDFRWYAIGEGDLRTRLLQDIKNRGLEENFILLGTFINPYSFLKRCDIYCQPSRFEGYGLAIAEARILNKPIIATNFEIVHNQLENEKNGLITEMNGKAVSQAILSLIDSETLINKLIKNLEKEKVGNESEILKVERLLDE